MLPLDCRCVSAIGPGDAALDGLCCHGCLLTVRAVVLPATEDVSHVPPPPQHTFPPLIHLFPSTSSPLPPSPCPCCCPPSLLLCISHPSLLLTLPSNLLHCLLPPAPTHPHVYDLSISYRFKKRSLESSQDRVQVHMNSPSSSQISTHLGAEWGGGWRWGRAQSNACSRSGFCSQLSARDSGPVLPPGAAARGPL